MPLAVGGDARAGGGYAIRVGVLVATSREQERCSMEEKALQFQACAAYPQRHARLQAAF